MSGDITERLGLMLIHPGQAQKEMTHNEALTALDLLTQACVVATGLNTPPSDPEPGQCWIVGTAPGGDWAGQRDAIAAWTAAGWRFAAARDGMRAWVVESEGWALFRDAAWRIGEAHGHLIVEGEQVVGPRAPAIEAPAGGAVVDAEARLAIAEILLMLEEHGLIEAP
jgi:hypothetical protein